MAYRDYQCVDCKHQWETFHLTLSDFDTACPKCSGEHLLRLIGAPALSFKGSGWWANDKHSYEPSKQISFGGDGTVIENLQSKDWKPPISPE